VCELTGCVGEGVAGVGVIECGVVMELQTEGLCDIIVSVCVGQTATCV
jgi:hypothetical protein